MATTKWFGVPFKNLVDGTAVWDWNTDTIKVALSTDTVTPDLDAHDFFADITNEVVGTGYTAGGVQLTTPTATYDTATDEIRLDADDAAWITASFTARWGIVYKDTATAATSPLIARIDFGANQTVSSGTFTIQFDVTGVVKADAT